MRSSSTILVTGGAGFIGSHFIERLLAAAAGRIVCLDNFNDFYDPAVKRANIAGCVRDPRVTLVEANFCEAAAVRQLFDDYELTHVVHLGAYAGVRPSIANPLLYEQTNVGGTLALLEAARQHPVERFLLISSSTVYGDGAAAPFVEDAPLGRPISPYGASKRAAELFGWTYHRLHGVPVVCLRPFSVYGPRLRPDLALWIWADAIHSGRKLPLFGDGTARRDFTFVSDICEGLLAALTLRGLVGETINLGHAEPIELRQAIAVLEAALGQTAQIEQLAPKPGEMPITYADLTKAQRLLNYEPRVSFEEGVREFVGWFRGR
ncbi:MAG TPA: NAD-dependent epimerase/dehydratase family protein [Pirellulales bacterium]|nr:NAD-dependent epimerase/dehydratase family protein [Pirellulales bacterium]